VDQEQEAAGAQQGECARFRGSGREQEGVLPPSLVGAVAGDLPPVVDSASSATYLPSREKAHLPILPNEGARAKDVVVVVGQEQLRCSHNLSPIVYPVSFHLIINDRDQVIGAAGDSLTDFHAVLWEDGTVEDLGTLGGAASYGSSINNASLIVGQAITGLPAFG
jgi:probable HAF family extracellular repeat protein